MFYRETYNTRTKGKNTFKITNLEFILNNRHNSYAELYEGLKLAQRGRLEDQRGTEIKFEMPDFLKREQQV